MPLSFRDFSPWSSPSASSRPQWENLPTVVERINHWLEAAGLRAVNIETLLLPTQVRMPPSSSAGSIVQRWDEDHAWVQVVRVWYEIPPTAAPAPQSYAPPSEPESPGSDATPNPYAPSN